MTMYPVEIEVHSEKCQVNIYEIDGRKFRAIGKYREHHIEEHNGTGLNDAMEKWKAKAERIDG